MKLKLLISTLMLWGFSASAQVNGNTQDIPAQCEQDNGYDPCAAYHLANPPATLTVCTDNGCYSVPNPSLVHPTPACHPDGDNPCAYTDPAPNPNGSTPICHPDGDNPCAYPY